MLPKQGKLLRICLGESDKLKGLLLYKWIVRKTREHGLASTTVPRGLEGSGAHSRLHTTRILRLSRDLPIVIEIVDTEENIEAFLPAIDAVFAQAPGRSPGKTSGIASPANFAKISRAPLTNS